MKRMKGGCDTINTLRFSPIAAWLSLIVSLFFKDRNEFTLNEIKGGLKAFLFINDSDLGFHSRGFAERGEELIRCHLDEDLRALGCGYVSLVQYPFPCKQCEDGVTDPCLSSFIVSRH